MYKILSLRLIVALGYVLILMPACKNASSKRISLSQQHFSETYDKLTVDTVESKPILRFEKVVKRKDGTNAIIQSVYPANELLVRLKPSVSAIQLQSFIQINKASGTNLTITDSLAEDRIYLISIDTGQVINSKTFSNRLMRSGLFRYAEPNFYSMNFSNQFPYLLDQGQWTFFNAGIEQNQFGGKFDADIDAIEAIGRLKDGQIPMQPVTVAIIDGGIDIFHYAFRNRLWRNPSENPNNNADDDGNGYIDDQYGWNFKSKTPVLTDNTGHGTHVAGVIGADPIPIAQNPGVSFNAKLMILKTTEDTAHTTLDVIAALKYAKRMKADVINMSIGQYNLSTPYREAIEEVINANIPIVAALGNDGLDIAKHPVYPACYWKVIGVANSNKFDELSAKSNYGSNPYPMFNHAMIAAPGENIYSTLPGSNYGNMTGTSMASPHVAGTVALIKSMDPGISILRIRNRLSDGADDIPSLMGKVEQGRRLNVYKALFAPSETYDANGTPYRDQLVNGRFRSSLLPYANAHEPGVDGKTPQTAYKIASMKQLMSIRNDDRNSYFILMNNIDWHELHPNERQPIPGTFNGNLFGQGFTIKNFDFQSGSEAGLFIRLGEDAVIQRLKFSGVNLKGGSAVGTISSTMSGSFINDVQVEGTISGDGSVGGLFGSTNGGQINNCYFEGQILSRQANGKGKYFGGISGFSTNTNMLNCHVECQITGLDFSGGLAGQHSGTIDHCYANGVVKGKRNVGGLVGFSLKGELSDSYAEGEVVGTENCGGLIGKIQNTFLSQCYAYVAVNCPLNNGGLIGKGHSFNLKNCYYLNNGINRPGAGGIAKSHYEMQQANSFSGWFPSTSWEMKYWMFPSLKDLPRSRGSLYLASNTNPPLGSTPNSSISRDKINRLDIPERLVWQWDDMTLTAGISLMDLQIIINSTDILTISGRMRSNDRKTHLSIAWLGLKLYNRSGTLLTNFKAIPNMPVSCNTNKVFSHTMNVPGFFNDAKNADWDFPPIVLNYCSK